MAGWLHRLRRMGAISFLVLRDGYGLFQAVFEDERELEPLLGLQPETVIEVWGRVVAEKQAPGGLELHECRLRVVTPVTETLPFEINKKVLKPGLDIFLDHAPVGLRHPHKQASRFPGCACGTWLYRDPDPQAGWYGNRGRRQRVCGRVL
jgi:nondiscriminating aspartyl-tRNA synthetase